MKYRGKRALSNFEIWAGILIILIILWVATSCSPQKKLVVEKPTYIPVDTRATNLLSWELGFMSGVQCLLATAVAEDTISLTQMKELEKNDFKFLLDSLHQLKQTQWKQK